MKRILITAVRYPPCEAIGAKRPSKMAKFLSEIGWDVTVLTVDPALTPPTGRAVMEIENLKIIRTKAFVPYVALRNRVLNGPAKNVEVTPNMIRARTESKRIGHDIKRFRNYLVRKSLTALDQVDQWSGWKRPALQAMRKIDTKFDVVLSTIPPYSTAILGMELAAYYKCKFVLDYRDPWTEMLYIKLSSGECSVRKLKRHIKLEEECLNASDLVLTVSPAISEMLSNRVNKKIMTILQGFEGAITESNYDKESRVLLYAGSLEYGRDISHILSAIKYVAETHHERMRLVYCGMNSELAYKQASSVGATEYIDIQGSVREHEVFAYAEGALCNIVIISPGYEYSYPGKVFELIPAGRPIYVISSSGSEAGELVEKYGVGYSIAATDIVSLAKKFKDEINRDFSIPSNVNDLKVENIYQRMVEEGLNML